MLVCVGAAAYVVYDNYAAKTPKNTSQIPETTPGSTSSRQSLCDNAGLGKYCPSDESDACKKCTGNVCEAAVPAQKIPGTETYCCPAGKEYSCPLTEPSKGSGAETPMSFLQCLNEDKVKTYMATWCGTPCENNITGLFNDWGLNRKFKSIAEMQAAYDYFKSNIVVECQKGKTNPSCSTHSVALYESSPGIYQLKLTGTQTAYGCVDCSTAKVEIIFEDKDGKRIKGQSGKDSEIWDLKPGVPQWVVPNGIQSGPHSAKELSGFTHCPLP
ncbi:MAG: hypothetical protein NT067_02490 [Candidatus Diapherotrites archaeon]|nr:hypothetical protein [Candidatus Diapherotrites archaeon]